MKVTEPIDVYLADKLFQLTSHDLPQELDDDQYRDALAGKTVVVFGGSYGIGADIVALAQRYGASVHAFSRSGTRHPRRAPRRHRRGPRAGARRGREDRLRRQHRGRAAAGHPRGDHRGDDLRRDRGQLHRPHPHRAGVLPLPARHRRRACCCSPPAPTPAAAAATASTPRPRPPPSTSPRRSPTSGPPAACGSTASTPSGRAPPCAPRPSAMSPPTRSWTPRPSRARLCGRALGPHRPRHRHPPGRPLQLARAVGAGGRGPAPERAPRRDARRRRGCQRHWPSARPLEDRVRFLPELRRRARRAQDECRRPRLQPGRVLRALRGLTAAPVPAVLGVRGRLRR